MLMQHARHTVFIGLALVALAASGCGKKDENAGDSDKGAAGKAEEAIANAADKAAETAADKVGQVVGNDQKPLTPEEYEALLLGLASCEIKGEHIDPKCPAKVAFGKARSRKNALKDLAGLTASLGKKHINHESPAVRVQAAGFLSSIFGADPSSQNVIVEAARAEKQPAVLVAMIQAVGSKGGRNPEIGKLLLEMADHDNNAVRKKAVVWLGSSWNEKLEGSIDKLIEKVEKDADPSVRQFACRYSGARGDDRMIPVYEKFTKDPSADPKLYAACMEGLMNSWMHYPLFGTHNEKAYKLTLKRLRHTPRGKQVPPWSLLDNFAELAKDSNKKVGEWKQKANWYKPADVLKVLEPIVVDPGAYRLARTGALKSMVALGADKKQLTRMRNKYGEPEKMDDKALVKELDKAIAAAK